MAPTYLMLLWHMHQPFYKDLVDGTYAMPWARLHALKDYYGMVAILRGFSSIHATFNLVPSLVAQLEDYARDMAREPAYDIAFKPADQLAAEERASLRRFAFQVNRENLLNRYPRFRELFEKLGPGQGLAPEAPLATQDVLDLQVLSQLAWFDEIYLEEDPDIRALVGKQRGYAETDKSLLRRKGVELFNKVLEEYKLALERGQIEISTSPFYHPILPLLCDTNAAAESRPGVRLPRREFRHPEDARDQLRAAVALHERVFGRRPQGLWPSEGSVSDAALTLIAEEGFSWAATDEGVLGRSLGMGFPRQSNGTVGGGQELYRPHRFEHEGREIALFFRDHQLSDLIGFVYSHMDAEAASTDLHQRIRQAGRSTGDRPSVVSVILDGENAWEFYPGNGREFLKKFYARLAADPEIRAVTASEALALVEPGRLVHIVPGSWINSNFDVWIGAEEDNRAWDLLGEARDFFAANFAKSAAPSEGAGQAQPAESAKLAQQELWIAEGSDWCWWYGPEHSSAQDEEFDLLFRKHLSNLYHLLGASPPDELAVPIKRLPAALAQHAPPMGRIEPRIDGRLTSYFEWLGAGVYAPEYRSGSMHGSVQYVEALYYGLSEQGLCLRLDLAASFLEAHAKFEVRINLDGETPARVQIQLDRGGPSRVELWKRGESAPSPSPPPIEIGLDAILELRLDRSLAGLAQKTQIQVSLWVDDIPAQVIPQEGWLTVEPTEESMSW